MKAGKWHEMDDITSELVSNGMDGTVKALTALCQITTGSDTPTKEGTVKALTALCQLSGNRISCKRSGPNQ